MTSASNMLMRSLVTYALVLPLALVLGYLLATPFDFSTVATVGLVCMILCLPLVLKWHRPILFFSWSTTAVVFFLPGHPELWLATAAASLVISVVQRTLVQQMRFIYAPSVLLPVFFLVAVVLATGYLTHSFGLVSLGASVGGAKSYFYIFGAAAGLVAMIAYRIPRQRAGLYAALFFLGSATNSIGFLAPYVPSWCYPIFLVFPVSFSDIEPLANAGFDSRMRLTGVGWACSSLTYYLLARYGIERLLQRGNRWRLLLLIGTIAAGTMAGFRNQLILLGLTCVFLFYLEGLFRSKYFLPLLVVCVAAGVLLVPFANKLPLAMQRSLSFLPLDVDPVAREDAENSTQWRVQMWRMVLPDVPKYFWLGKGVGISVQELAASDVGRQSVEAQQESNILVGNYHNGPLSLLLNFGVWGAIGFLWFAGASLRVLYLNYRYGEPHLKELNTFLLANFAAKTIHFLFIFGDFRGQFAEFAGLIGFSLALNYGIRKPVQTTIPFSIPIKVREPANPS